MNENIKLYQGDCLDVMNQLIADGVKVDVIITDPPYGIDYQSNWGRNGRKLDKIKNDNSLDWFQDFSDLAYDVLKDDSAFYCFTRADVYPFMYNCLVQSGFKFKNLLVIQKGQKGGNGDLQAQYSNDCEMVIYMNKGRRKFNKTKLAKTDGRKGASEYRTRLPNVWFDTSYNIYPKATVNVSNQNGSTIHPTEKNIELISWWLNISASENDFILDPFMGSGSTGVACVNTNRKFIGIELDEGYYKIASERIHKASSKKENI